MAEKSSFACNISAPNVQWTYFKIVELNGEGKSAYSRAIENHCMIKQFRHGIARPDTSNHFLHLPFPALKLGGTRSSYFQFHFVLHVAYDAIAIVAIASPTHFFVHRRASPRHLCTHHLLFPSTDPPMLDYISVCRARFKGVAAIVFAACFACLWPLDFVECI